MLPNGGSGLRSDYVYEGLTTKITVGGRSMSRTYGSLGWLYETVDADGGTNRFAYDAAGRALVIQGANNLGSKSKIAASYNGFGFKTQVNDPNQGITTFGYNSLGELDKQTDANGVVQSYSLDVLGRVTQKVTSGGNAPGTASYTWDTLKKGLLSSESENGVTRTYGYTAALQLSQTSVTVDGVTRTVKHQYDGFYGRPKGLEYPNGLTLKYGYNDFGYLETVSNAASGYVYRQISAMDATGHITGAELGNGIITEARGYSSEGNMRLAEAFGPMGQIHGHYYDAYDGFMNLRSERDAITGLERRYDYDNLNRLQHYSFWTNAQDHADIDYAYDKVGNLLKKTDFSLNKTNAYQYGGAAVCAAGSNAGPNAVCQIEKLNNTAVKFTYDKRGNMLTGDGLTMTYDALDKPLNIVGGRGGAASANTSFVYGSDGMRAKQSRTISGTTTSTYYVDKYYEADSDGSWRAYLDDIAVLSYTPQRQHLLHFTLRDRLGSATTMADQNGNPISHRYFDPFGRTADVGNSHRLDILNRNTNLSRLADLDITNRNRRGFTDHEHLNEQQLIHMNGRVYDYNLGRFLSVDPLIQSPTSTQSINPYSYIMNNPLAGTDPTGYCATTDNVQDCADSIESGTTQDITDKDGKTVGTVGKDSQGNMYITKGNGASAHQGIQSAMSNADNLSDIGSLNETAKLGNTGQGKDAKINANASRVTSESTHIEGVAAVTDTDIYPEFNIPEKYREQIQIENIREAYDFISIYNQESIFFDTEYGAIFGKDGSIQVGIPIGDGQVGFSHGGQNDVYYVKSDAKVTGFFLSLRGIEGKYMVHSHGGSGPKRSYFSRDDQIMSKAGNMAVFMSNHKGEFRVYLPSMKLMNTGSQGVLLCENCVPN
ncbi:RHS repeat domain-containing protein [Shewanella sedimentimangrovi]|uniref:YD repeat protein n=1 Tax=Shewanella sedimentimangrovi TaxID=2814293 RepID=A0ABX7R0U2_9GAMM|nr:RHS repeat-associated core domain-containing protein [Shewanella sedimentimangrovi]QSX37099.1 hypothetical protein JYB85_17885 [Shewanella sedimentimangrovi]